MPKRLFIALELPVGCREALAALAEPIPGVRWVAADQLHVTLAFLGNMDAETEQQLRDNLAELGAPEFSLRLSGVGMFRARRPTTIWARVDDVHGGLRVLHGEVLRSLAAAHIETRPASFHPHITLARLKDVPARRLRSFLEASQSREFGTVAVEGFTLFSSVLRPAGAAYGVEERYSLVTR
jgi:2'-5' RNA ligase